jgi:hypothetical protein
MQPRRPEPGIELNRLLIGCDMQVIMAKQRLADEVVDCGERSDRIGDQRLVTNQQQSIEMLAPERYVCLVSIGSIKGGVATPAGGIATSPNF